VSGLADEHNSERGMRMHIHLHESLREVSDHQQNNQGMRPIDRLQKLGIIDDKLIAAHMCHVTEDDIKLWVDKGELRFLALNLHLLTNSWLM